MTLFLTRATLAAAALLAMTASARAADDGDNLLDILYLSCAEAHQQVGEDEQKAVALVTEMTKYLIEKRGITVPEDRGDLSQAFGELVKAHCLSDPDSLLLSAIDRSMRQLL